MLSSVGCFSDIPGSSDVPMPPQYSVEYAAVELGARVMTELEATIFWTLKGALDPSRVESRWRLRTLYAVVSPWMCTVAAVQMDRFVSLRRLLSAVAFVLTQTRYRCFCAALAVDTERWGDLCLNVARAVGNKQCGICDG